MKAEKSYLIVIVLLSIFIVVGYFSYAMFTVNKEQKEAIRIITGTLPATLSSSDSDFKDNKITVSKDSSKDITITLTNNNERNAKYNFYYKDNISEKVHINYYKDTKDIPPTEEGVVIKSKESQSYKLKITNLTNEDITVEFGSVGGLENKELSFPNNGKIIEGIVVEVERPADNMIPVIYNESKKKWITTTYDDPNWYNYDKQEWANAITVRENVRSSYQVAGKEVDIENDVLTMFVWIPRYSYTIKSEDGKNYYGKKEEGRSDEPSQALPGEIDVKFISTSTTDEGSAQYTGDIATNWYTPPGFTFGEKNLSGIWIGKFETGYMGASSTAEAQKDTEEANKVIIKPNVYSWRGIRVSTLELVSRQITLEGNVFGFNQTTYDSHAAKNTERAIISYLTQSKYGKYGNSLYTGENKQVYMNNFNGYMTGRSSGVGTASSSAEEGAVYNDLINKGNGQGYGGAGASSTGNITGIYDINGGAWEYTMGVLEKRSGNTASSNSGYPGLLTDGNFTSDRNWPDDKYLDVYTSTNVETACGGVPCKGHAMNEVAGWYGDTHAMLNVITPWLLRGGGDRSGANAGIFDYYNVEGNAFRDRSFRIVLTPE